MTCLKEEKFTCKDNQKTICYDKVCDSVNDCSDSSDEFSCCIIFLISAFLDFVVNIYNEIQTDGNVEFRWTMKHFRQSTSFIIIVENMLNIL